MDKARELKDKVEDWVNREFNFLPVSALEKVSDGYLFGYIRPIPQEEAETDEEYYERVEYDENYPMWSTCFEIRSNWAHENWIEKAQEIGLGVIEGLDDFNPCFFMTSCGHSFYSAYWIPLYLALYPAEAETYKGVDFQHV